MTDLNEITAKLHEGLAKELLARVLSGEATTTDLNVARQFLKDNGVDSVVQEKSPLAELGKVLPFHEDDPISQAD